MYTTDVLRARRCGLRLLLPTVRNPRLPARSNARLLAQRGFYRAFVWMGAYGGFSPKPSWIYSNHPGVSTLSSRPKPQIEWPKDKQMVKKCPGPSHVLGTCVSVCVCCPL